MWNWFQEQNSWGRFSLFLFVFTLFSISYIAVTALVNELLGFNCGQAKLCLPYVQRYLPDPPRQNGLQSTIRSFSFCRLPSVLTPNPTGMRSYSPMQQELGWIPGDFCCPEEGVEDCGVQQEAKNVGITICFSWPSSMHYLLAKILLKLLSKYI